jgi:dTDP-4-amino-4,6-dideoxygalactose transaminase
VITTPYSFFATAGSIARLGAKPVFVDIDPVTYNIDPSLIADKVTPRTKAIMPVHLYGQCCDMAEILEVAARHGLYVIEDACQAIGAEYRNRRAGSLGDAGCFSFFPSKNLGGFGDGGAITTNDSVLAEKLRCLRNHGMEPKYHHKYIGGNFRLDALQAAVLRVKLKYLDIWTARRQRNAVFYDGAFGDLGMTLSLVATPAVVQSRHIFNQYVLRVANRNALKAYLDEVGVGTEIYYPVPLHLQECFDYLGYRRGDFPESEAAANSTLAIPIYPEITSGRLQKVVDSIAEYYRSVGKLTTRRVAA